MHRTKPEDFPSMLLASELYAISQGSVCTGPDECHWCAAKCDRHWTHDDPPPIVGIRRERQASRRPASPYLCVGCWLWRRGSLTATYLSGGFRDRQQPKNHSWWITETGAWALRFPQDATALWERLLKPPKRFILTLLDGPVLNLLQLAVANDVSELRGDTELLFTVNNVPMRYTLYELEQALRTDGAGAGGREPGVRELIRLLGRPAKMSAKADEKPRGRPPRTSGGGDPPAMLRETA